MVLHSDDILTKFNNDKKYYFGFVQFYKKLNGFISSQKCFHEDSSCTDISKAHCIQNRILLNLCDKSKKVYFSYFDFYLKPISKTSTFNGFCNKHDNDIFRLIDTNDFSENNTEQEFLYAYKACAKEWFYLFDSYKRKKFVYDDIINNGGHRISKIVKGGDIKGVDIEEQKKYLLAVEKQLKIFEEYKNKFNYYIDNKEYKRINTVVFCFDKKCFFASTFVKILNNIPFFISVFPQDGKSVIIFSTFKRNQRILDIFRDKFSLLEQSEKEVFISNIVLNTSNNIAIAPLWWDSLEIDVRRGIKNIYFESHIDQNARINNTINLFS